MKKLIVRNFSGEIIDLRTGDDFSKIIEKQKQRLVWGKPEREELDSEGNPTGVILPAEYTISIIDLSQDSEWLLQECHRKRLQEYPSLGEFADAYVKLQQGDSSQMDAYVLKCIEVKIKHPKP